MYLHLGQDTVVRMDEIIGIFDIETSTISYLTRDYLAEVQKKGYVVNVSEEMPKSFVPCINRKREKKVYISQISTSTLLKRTKYMKTITND